MKTLFSVLCTLLITSSYANEISVESKIKHVTVFQRAAQIQRSAQVKVPKGKHQIVLTNLSTRVNQNSIQITGDKDITILSVSFQQNYLKNNEENVATKRIQDSLNLMSEKLIDIKNNQWLLREEKDLLLKNKALSQTGSNNNTEEIIKRANFYRLRLREIVTEETKENKKHNECQAIINKLNAQLRQNRAGKGKSVGEIVIEVESKLTQTTSMQVSYNVSGAGWYPVYNLKSKSITSPLQLEYNAKVYQLSGVAWKNVNLSLSTANPQHNIQKPNLTPWRLVFQNRNYGGAYIKSNRSTQYNIQADEVEDAALSEAPSPSANFTAPPVNITQHQTAVSFDLKTKYTIESNNKHYGVTVSNYELPASYTYYAAPKLRKKAFLLAKTSDWQQYNLIPGKTNFFFENTFVGSSILNLSGAQDTLDISLGIDDNIIIDRKRVKDFCKAYAIGSDKKEEIGIEITVTNNKNTSIELLVEDQIPVSGNNKISVDLLNAKKADHDLNSGKLTWKLKLKPGESKKLRFGYSIKYPKGMQINL